MLQDAGSTMILTPLTVFAPGPLILLPVLAINFRATRAWEAPGSRWFPRIGPATLLTFTAACTR